MEPLERHWSPGVGGGAGVESFLSVQCHFGGESTPISFVWKKNVFQGSLNQRNGFLMLFFVPKTPFCFFFFSVLLFFFLFCLIFLRPILASCSFSLFFDGDSQLNLFHYLLSSTDLRCRKRLCTKQSLSSKC